jgi:hypothetical protein
VKIPTRQYTIVTSHGTLAVEERGERGIPVLLIHGNWTCRRVFYYQMQGRIPEITVGATEGSLSLTYGGISNVGWGGAARPVSTEFHAERGQLRHRLLQPGPTGNTDVSHPPVSNAQNIPF